MNGRPSRKLSVDCVAGMPGSKKWRSGCGVRSVGRNEADAVFEVWEETMCNASGAGAEAARVHILAEIANAGMMRLPLLACIC